MLLHMPPLLDGRWFLVLVLRFICGFVIFIFAVVFLA